VLAAQRDDPEKRRQQFTRKFLRQAAKMIFVTGFMVALPPLAFPQAVPATSAAVLAALQKGQNTDAVRIADAMLRADPHSHQLWTLRAVGLERSGHSSEALAAYLLALSFAPDYLPALEGAAQINYKAQSPQAIPLLRRIVSLQPASATAHAMLGVLEYGQKDYAPAAQDFAAAGDALNSQPDALTDYAICLVHLDRASEAIARFQQLVALEPQNASARYDLALSQWRASKAADSLTTLQPLLDAQPPDSHALRLAAAIHESNNETPQAIELLRAAIAAAPSDVASYLDFATLAAAHRSFLVGVDIVTLGIKQLPNSAPLFMARGVLYGQNDDIEKAMADFERAHALDPSNSMVDAAEGVAQSQKHNHEAALENFKRQVREHPKDAFGHYLLAEAISWSPSDEKSVHYRETVNQAIAEAAKATELDPRLVQAYDLLCSLYMQNEQIDRAIKASRVALKIAPKDQQALYTLILALRKTTSKDELKDLVRRLSDLRDSEAVESNKKAHYGQLVEER
jgi:tetratricopeptide (TPR) repeat protein